MSNLEQKADEIPPMFVIADRLQLKAEAEAVLSPAADFTSDISQQAVK